MQLSSVLSKFSVATEKALINDYTGRYLKAKMQYAVVDRWTKDPSYGDFRYKIYLMSMANDNVHL